MKYILDGLNINNIIWNDSQKQGWGRWLHNITFDLSALPNWAEEIVDSAIVSAFTFLRHCAICTRLSDCLFYFPNAPKQPQHFNCHCKYLKVNKPIANVTAFAEINKKKITDYVFSDHSGGKKELFEGFGFSVNDADYIKMLYETQAVKKYCQGNYYLHKLDDFGQRIVIDIDIAGHTIKTGWIVKPRGHIWNTTPFGGWTYEL